MNLPCHLMTSVRDRATNKCFRLRTDFAYRSMSHNTKEPTLPCGEKKLLLEINFRGMKSLPDSPVGRKTAAFHHRLQRSKTKRREALHTDRSKTQKD